MDAVPTIANEPPLRAASLAARLRLVGDATGLRESAELVADAVGLDYAEREEMIALSIDRSRSLIELADALSDEDDEEELYRVIAALWLQLRFEWQRHNDVLNYAAVGDTPNSGLAAEGSIGSAILQRLENLLLPLHLDALSGHAQGLLSTVGSGLEVTA